LAFVEIPSNRQNFLSLSDFDFGDFIASDLFGGFDDLDGEESIFGYNASLGGCLSACDCLGDHFYFVSQSGV
jgi:hypothetical protein